MDSEEWVAINITGFGGARRGHYFGEETVNRTDMKMTMKKLKNSKAAGKDEVAREIIRVGVS